MRTQLAHEALQKADLVERWVTRGDIHHLMACTVLDLVFAVGDPINSGMAGWYGWALASVNLVHSTLYNIEQYINGVPGLIAKLPYSRASSWPKSGWNWGRLTGD